MIASQFKLISNDDGVGIGVVWLAPMEVSRDPALIAEQGNAAIALLNALNDAAGVPSFDHLIVFNPETP